MTGRSGPGSTGSTRRGSGGGAASEAEDYASLGVEPSATPAELRKAYLRLAMQHYPDRPGSGDRAAYDQVSEAFEALSSCRSLKAALAKSGAARMVVGHTVMPEGKVGSTCGGLLWGTDVGMSAGMMGSPAAVLQLAAGGNFSAAVPPPGGLPPFAPTPLYA